MIGRKDIDRIRQLGLIEHTSAGREAVRMTVQCRRSSAGHSRESWRSVLREWELEVARVLSGHGGEVVPGTLSVAGQTIEAVVPVDEVDAVLHEAVSSDVRFDLVVPRRVATKT